MIKPIIRAISNSRLYELTIPCADGRMAYYKLEVDPLKESLFNRACKDGLTVDLTQFGTIVESRYLPRVIEPLATEAM